MQPATHTTAQPNLKPGVAFAGLPVRDIEPVDAFVGAQVRLRRRTLGVSQQALADALGISFQQVQKYENGANRVSCSMLARIAERLNARPADFFPATVEEAATDEAAVFRDVVRAGGDNLLRTFLRAGPQQRAAILVAAEAIAGAAPVASA